MVFSFFIAWLRQAQPPFGSLSLSKWYYYAGDFDRLNHRFIFIITPGAWACRRHILIPLPCDFDSAQSPCHIHSKYRCLSLSKAHSHSSSLWFRLRTITVLYPFKIPVPELVEGTFLFSSSLWFRLRSITVLYLLLLSVPEPVEGTFFNPFLYNFLIIKANRLLCSPSKPLSFSCSNPEPAFLDKKLHLFCQILRNRPIAQATFFGCG